MSLESWASRVPRLGIYTLLPSTQFTVVLRDGSEDSICEKEAQPKLALSAGGSTTCEEPFYVTSLPGLERAHRLGVTLIFPACPRTDLILFQHDNS